MKQCSHTFLGYKEIEWVVLQSNAKSNRMGLVLWHQVDMHFRYIRYYSIPDR